MKDFKETSFFAALFLLSLATLMQEILLTRIFSVVTWYHFAFLAISVAMFGITVGAVAVYLFQSRFSNDRLGYNLSLNCLLFSIAVLLSCLAQVSLPFGFVETATGIVLTSLVCIVISLPFLFNGICLALIFKTRAGDIGRIYATNLAGAGLGCLLLPLLLDILDGPSAVLLVAFLGTLGAYGFAASFRIAGMRKKIALISTGLFLLAAVNAGSSYAGNPLLRIWWSKGLIEVGTLHEKWNSFSRIRVFGSPDRPTPPVLWGPSSNLPPDIVVRQLSLTIDGSALTVMTAFDGSFEELDYLTHDVTNFVHFLRPDSRVAVVGVGGGRDILSALAFGQRSILAVEVNDAIVELLRSEYEEFTGYLHRHPKVQLVNDEARSYLSRLSATHDIIQLSLTDTWAATASGAYALTENSLYTTEAWTEFYSRLSARGILSVSRWHVPENPVESYRLMSLATAVLLEVGVENPARHLALVRSPVLHDQVGVATLLLARHPFSNSDVTTIGDVSRRLGYEIDFLAGDTEDPNLETLTSKDQYSRFVAGFRYDIAAPVDDRPFFFQTSRVADFISPSTWKQAFSGSISDPVYLLGILLVVFFVLSCVCMFAPLLVADGISVMRNSQLDAGFFAGIGLGFMLVEISVMQKLNIFLGHPVYGLVVVLFALLVSGGVGSFLTKRMEGQGFSRWCLVHFAGLLILLTLAGLTLDLLIHEFRSASMNLRIAVSVMAVSAMGFMMGMAFPLAIKRAERRSAAVIPWLWAINGSTSVMASVFAMVLSLSYGISTSFWVGVVSYLGSFLFLVRSTRQTAQGRTDVG